MLQAPKSVTVLSVAHSMGNDVVSRLNNGSMHDVIRNTILEHNIMCNVENLVNEVTSALNSGITVMNKFDNESELFVFAFMNALSKTFGARCVVTA